MLQRQDEFGNTVKENTREGKIEEQKHCGHCLNSEGFKTLKSLCCCLMYRFSHGCIKQLRNPDCSSCLERFLEGNFDSDWGLIVRLNKGLETLFCRNRCENPWQNLVIYSLPSSILVAGLAHLIKSGDAQFLMTANRVDEK